MEIPYNVEQAIKYAASKTGVSESLLRAFAFVESGFGQNTLSQTGVRGLFQITGNTWKSVRKKYGLSNAYNTDFNEQALTAALLIKDLSTRYNGDRDLIAIAYNAGESVADKVRRFGKSAISSAVESQRRKGGSAAKGFGPGKVKEILDYPVKIAKALGEPVTTGTSINNTNNNKTEVTSTTSVVAKKEFDTKKPIIINLFSGANSSITEIATMIKNDPNLVKNSILVERIRVGMATRG